MISLSRRGLSAALVAALLTAAPLSAGVAVASDTTVASVAASSATLTYGPGDGYSPIWVTVDGTQLTASWAPTIDGPTHGYRVHLWDYTVGAYVLETHTMATSYSATIVRGHHYLAFYQDLSTNMAVYQSGWVDFTPPPVPDPNPVTNLSATRLETQNGFAVAWLAPANNTANPATSYRLDVSASGTLQRSITTAQTSVQVSGLTIGASYTFTVVAIADDAKTSTPVSTVATLGPVAPTAVTNLSLALSGSGLSASWSAPAYDGGGALTYEVSLHREQSLVSVTYLTATSLAVLATAEYGVSYHVTVRALAASVYAGPSTSSTSVTRSTPAPGAPTGISAARLATANGVDLTWNAPAENSVNPAVSYRIAVTSGSVTTHHTTSALSHRFTDLTVGQSYTFAVSSVAADAQTSAAASTAVVLQAIEPGAVSNVAITATDSVLAATWTPPAYDGGASSLGYQVTLRGDSQVLGVYTVTEPAVTFAEPADYGVTYSAEITPVTSDDLAGPSTMSNSVQRADFAPGAPVAWAEAYGHKDAMVYVTWDLATTPGSPVTSLLVTLYDESGVIVEQRSLSPAYTSYSFSGLPNSTAYTASVVAANLAGPSAESNRAPATTLDLVPPAYTPAQLDQLGNAAGVTVMLADGELTAHLDGVPEGTWVFGHAYSSPVALGWTQIDADGFARWSIVGTGLAAGATHTLAVQDSFGGLLGYAAFAIPAPPASASLATAGIDDPAGWVLIALAMLSLGAILSVTRRRRTAAA